MSETTFVHYTFTASFCRLIDEILMPSTLKVKCEMLILDEDEMHGALRRVDYWTQNCLPSAVALSASNDIGFDMLLDENKAPRLMNNLMVTPYEPTDQHLAIIFQSKLEALSGGAYAVGLVEVSSDVSEGLSFTYIGDNEDDLPTMQEWIKGPSWFKFPWWARNDVSMIDTQAPEGSDLTKTPIWAQNFDFLEADDSNPEAVILNFEPRIIEGENNPDDQG